MSYTGVLEVWFAASTIGAMSANLLTRLVVRLGSGEVIIDWTGATVEMAF